MDSKQPGAEAGAGLLDEEMEGTSVDVVKQPSSENARPSGKDDVRSSATKTYGIAYKDYKSLLLLTCWKIVAVLFWVSLYLYTSGVC